jgi:PAS domain S-box-containing protein
VSHAPICGRILLSFLVWFATFKGTAHDGARMTQKDHVSFDLRGDGSSSTPIHRQSDETFRHLVDSVQDYAIFLLSPEGTVVTWNQGAQRIKGYNADEIIGKHFSRFYPRQAIESRWPDRELELAGKEGRFTDEGLRVRKDGSTFWAAEIFSDILIVCPSAPSLR